MSQKLHDFPVHDFKWIEDTSQLFEDFIRDYNVESNGGFFLEVEVQYLEKLHELHNDLPVLPERKKTCI